MNKDKIMAHIMAFKGQGADELYSTDDEVLEVTETTPEEAEIAFNHIRGERIYIRFNIADLMRAIHQHGREA